jgi:hypothetical protein
LTIGTDIRAIWIASIPRTGSMWTFNVVRDLVRSTGRPALPEIVPQDDREMETIGRQGIDAADGVYVLKVHTPIAADLRSSLFVVTRRDIHDSVVSFMRFTHADFEAGLRFAAGAIRLDEHYSRLPSELTLPIAYVDIIASPATVVAAIAGRLAVEAPQTLVDQIVDRYSKRNVVSRVSAREEQLRAQISARQPVDRRDFVPQSDKSLRAFDTATGFQSGHVSDYHEGDWRRILTASQQAALDALIADGEGWRARQRSS